RLVPGPEPAHLLLEEGFARGQPLRVRAGRGEGEKLAAAGREGFGHEERVRCTDWAHGCKPAIVPLPQGGRGGFLDGSKAGMAEITKSYEPGEVEKKWYAAWQKAGAFAGRVDPAREAYSIVIPPPNVTGVL